MKILLVSDTHGHTKELAELLEQYKDDADIKMVVHMGDLAEDLLGFKAQYPGLTLEAVSGNTDYYANAPSELLLTVTDTFRIFVTHGHTKNVKMGLDRLAYYAKEKGAAACFFGHTHMPIVTAQQGIFVMNPGSLVEPRDGSKAGYGIVTISETGAISGEVISI